jgi:CRP-like cAMP-binding protein
MHQVLTPDERARLADMASIVGFKKGEVIYRKGDRADAVFNIIGGTVAAYKKAPDGGEHIVAFLLPDDFFGLSEEGRYANSTKAIAPVTAYSLPVTELREQLSESARREYLSFASSAKTSVHPSVMRSCCAREQRFRDWRCSCI